MKTATLIDLDLSAYSTSALLDAVMALTHRVHECGGNIVAGECTGPCGDLRAQRDLAIAEILRRAA